MSFALIKDWRVMCRGPAGVEWHTIARPLPLPPMLWPTREGARDAAEIQGATVIPENQLKERR
jgi:hypothetical protein